MFHNRIQAFASMPEFLEPSEETPVIRQGFMAIPLHFLPTEMQVSVHSRANIYQLALEQAQLDALFNPPRDTTGWDDYSI